MRAGDRLRCGQAHEEGTALLTAVVATSLLTALGLMLVLAATIETWVVTSYRHASEVFFAADAGIERALPDLGAAADWSAVLNGSSGSTFVDGAAGLRTLADGRPLDLLEVVNRANCGRAAPCSPGELDAVTSTRPWGSNNPRWRLFMHGTLDSLSPGHALRSACYVVVLVADDPSENDNDPLRDGAGAENPGAGILLVRSEAYGPNGAHRIIEATVEKAGGHPLAAAPVRLLSWRETRERDY
jgi:hypothetical protein